MRPAPSIDRQVVQESDGWFVIIPREETKTRTPIEFPVPEMLKRYLATYPDVVHPRMLQNRISAAFWLNRFGGALSYAAIYLISSRHSRNRLGFHIAPHHARDAAATTWALLAPAQIGVAHDILAHSDLRTTTKYYNRARGIEASRVHSHVITGLRRKLNRRSRG